MKRIRPNRDPVGRAEIARRAGVSPSAVDNWRSRHPDTFPQPRWRVGNRPAWDWPDIAKWLESTGRSTAA